MARIDRLSKSRTGANELTTTARILADALAAESVDWAKVGELSKRVEAIGCQVRRNAKAQATETCPLTQSMPASLPVGHANSARPSRLTTSAAPASVTTRQSTGQASFTSVSLP